jgi:putative effector of murein hydrolase
MIVFERDLRAPEEGGRMSLIDTIGIILGVFVAVFSLFIIAFNRSDFDAYYADLDRRGLGRVLTFLVKAVFVLSVPFFYDMAKGFNNATLSITLELVIGMCAAIVLADVGWYIYKTFGPGAKPPRHGNRPI